MCESNSRIRALYLQEIVEWAIPMRENYISTLYLNAVSQRYFFMFIELQFL